LCRYQGDLATPLALFEESIAIERRLGNKGQVGLTLINLGSVHALAGNVAQAMAVYDEAHTIERELGNREVMAVALAYLAQDRILMSDYAAAREPLDEALVVWRETGPWFLCVALDCLSLLSHAEGDLVTAEASARESVAVWREAQHAYGVAYSLLLLARAMVDLGDPEQ